MPKMHKFAMLVATLVLIACGPGQEQVARQRALDQQYAIARDAADRCFNNFPPPPTRATAVPLHRCVFSALRIVHDEESPVASQWLRNIVIAERYRDGYISMAEFNLMMNQSAATATQQREDRVARERIVVAQEQQARGINCMSARVNNRTADNTGLNSTNGAVAIISLLGAVGGVANEINACN